MMARPGTTPVGRDSRATREGGAQGVAALLNPPLGEAEPASADQIIPAAVKYARDLLSADYDPSLADDVRNLARAVLRMDRLVAICAADRDEWRSGFRQAVGLAGLREQRAERAEAARDAAIREMTKCAREAGEAKGRLEMSEAAGIVDGWRERAETAEAARDHLVRRVAELERARDRRRTEEARDRGRSVPPHGSGP